MMGELGELRLQVVGAELGQGRPHLVVEPPSLPARQLVVQRLADQGVREPEAARPGAGLGHQAGVHRLLQRVQDLVGRQAGGAGDHVEVELPALDAGHREAGVDGVREPVQPPADHVPDPFRDTAGEQPGSLQAVLGDQQPHQLAHEIGVALGLAVEGDHQLGRRVDPGDVGDEPAHLALVEAAKGQARGHRLAEQLGQGAAQAVVPVHLDVPVGGDQQQARVGQLPRHELQQQQAGPVGPVEVVEDDHQTGVGRCLAERGGHGVEEAEPGHLGVERGRRQGPRGGHRQLGHELAELGRVLAELGGQRRGRAAGGQGAQRQSPRPVGGRALTLVAAAPHHPDLAGPGVGGELLGDAGLADARLAGDEHELPLSAEGAVERGPQPGPLGVPADEGELVGMLGALRHRRRGSGELGMDQREDVLGPGQPRR
jgi:hypothetical protein